MSRRVGPTIPLDSPARVFEAFEARVAAREEARWEAEQGDPEERVQLAEWEVRPR